MRRDEQIALDLFCLCSPRVASSTADAFPRVAGAVPLFAAAFGGFVVRFPPVAPDVPRCVARSPGFARAGPVFGEAIPGVASTFQR